MVHDPAALGQAEGPARVADGLWQADGRLEKLDSVVHVAGVDVPVLFAMLCVRSICWIYTRRAFVGWRRLKNYKRLVVKISLRLLVVVKHPRTAG